MPFTKGMLRVVTLSVLMTAMAAADVIVTLVPQDDNTNVPVGASVPVDILLSVDGDDNPLVDVRFVQFDFGDTSANITVSAFEWEIDIEFGTTQYAEFPTLPSPSIAYTGSSGAEGFIINLSEAPLRVATVTVIATGSGTLDAVSNVGEPSASGAQISADFARPDDFIFNRVRGNLTGGVLNFEVAVAGGGGGSLPDADDDEVPDAVDDFPNDNDETTDTDNDNIGNVEDTDDDDDGIDDDEDPTPLGPQEVIDNDNQSNDNANDNTSGGNGDNENDNGDTNMGPRATGGIFCAQGMIFALLGSFIGLSATQWVRRRRAIDSPHQS